MQQYTKSHLHIHQFFLTFDAHTYFLSPLTKKIDEDSWESQCSNICLLIERRLWAYKLHLRTEACSWWVLDLHTSIIFCCRIVSSDEQRLTEIFIMMPTWYWSQPTNHCQSLACFSQMRWIHSTMCGFTCWYSYLQTHLWTFGRFHSILKVRGSTELCILWTDIGCTKFRFLLACKVCLIP